MAWGATAASLVAEPRHLLTQDDEAGLRSLAQDFAGEGYRVEALATGPHALDAVEQPTKTLLIVAGVERAYSPGEVEAIVGFVERGGIALIADDFGFGDPVGVRFGVNFDGRVLRDAAFEGNQSLVRINVSLADANSTILTNVPSSLGFAPGVNASLIAASGPDSYLDTNQDGLEEPGDVKGPHAVMAAVPRGKGQAVFASDPGLLTNAVWNENAPFLKALAASLLPEGGAVVVDESRHAMGWSGAFASLLAGEVQGTSEPALAVLVGIAACALAALLLLGFDRPEDIGAHRSRLGDPVHAWDHDTRAERLRDLAAHAVADAKQLSSDQRASLSRAQLAPMAGDPVLASLLRGEPPRADDEDLLKRIQAFTQRSRSPGGKP
ncbi:MAG TPA: DUF4350 domain-containing protein [Candidatus Thermoplasmatota archaeon]|nr:DUF4350 domain-containing protein [Candidatus Thermoplasmatota archaeon]